MRINSINKIKLLEIGQNYYNLDLNSCYEIISKNIKKSKKEIFMLDNIWKYRQIIKDFKLLKKWYPIEYINKNWLIYWLNFFVKPWVLIPRNDTEVMVTQAINELNKDLNTKYSIIDVWTWSWCIIISVLKNTKNIINWFWFDISRKALNIAHKNIKNHWLKKIIKLEKSNLLSRIKKLKNLQKDIIITANLPYILDKDFKNMDKSVIKYEPQIALYWWKETWFELYEHLILECLKLKNIHNITLFIEIWFDQYMYSKFFLENLWLKFEYFKDMNNINRLIKIYI